MSYYNIASTWQESSDEDVELFKKYLVEKTRVDPLSIKGVLCRKDWFLGTYIDVYVAIIDNDALLHYRINRNDQISDASSED